MPRTEDWIARTRSRLTDLSHDIRATDAADLPALATQVISAIDTPHEAGHETVLAMLLIDFASQIVRAFHEREAAAPCRCYARALVDAACFSLWQDRDPRVAFREWTAGFLTRFVAAHPPTAAMRAAALIRQDPQTHRRLADLARLVAVHPDLLRRQFGERYGLSPSRYLQLIRTTRAVALFSATTKVEAIAWEVGYRSKKDLYAALRRWVGLTPGELRALSDRERTWLDRQLRVRAIGGWNGSGNLNRRWRNDQRTLGRIDVGIGVEDGPLVGDR